MLEFVIGELEIGGVNGGDWDQIWEEVTFNQSQGI